MQLTDHPRKNSDNKLLAFRSPTPRGAFGALTSGLHLNDVPHDIATLRRPVDVETLPLPQLDEPEELARDARNLLTSIELFASLLAEPGVLAEEHQHFASDLKSLTIPLAGLAERMARVSGAGAAPAPDPDTDWGTEPVFRREPLRKPLGPGHRIRPAASHGQRALDQSDAGVMVKSCERLLGAIAGPAVSLQISYERGLGELALSSESVTRVLINLVRNASEAMPQGGRITINVRKGLGAKPSALLTVQDTGSGIPAHALGQVFQAGFSSKRAQERWPSASHHGLGLTIVRELVEGAGGSVRVASTLRKGTCFEIKLPCRRD